jgi:riboflavin biosynthesis pyrimidine reductase
VKACYPKNEYDYDAMKLEIMYTNPDVSSFSPAPVQTKSSKKVFGELRFPAPPAERVYTMACFVTSIDAKVAFPDNPAGPVVARANRYDPAGAEADFWSLNLFRANADAVIGGAKTMREEPDGVVCIFDRELEDERLRKGMPHAPWMVINSLDGRDIPFDDALIRNQPVVFHTSPAGRPVVERGLKAAGFTPRLSGPYISAEAAAAGRQLLRREFEKYSENPGTAIPVLVTGEERRTNPRALLTALRGFGLARVLVESPSFLHVLLQSSLLDEALLNTSGVYIGGDAVGFGNGMTPCTSDRHPHAEILSIHMHSPVFIYSRYRFLYDE